MISYFHIESIAKMLTARPDNGVTAQRKSGYKTRHFQFKKSFDITKKTRSLKILMSAEIMSMSHDIKLKET